MPKEEEGFSKGNLMALIVLYNKNIARSKHSSLFCPALSDKEKCTEVSWCVFTNIHFHPNLIFEYKAGIPSKGRFLALTKYIRLFSGRGYQYQHSSLLRPSKSFMTQPLPDRCHSPHFLTKDNKKEYFLQRKPNFFIKVECLSF